MLTSRHHRREQVPEAGLATTSICNPPGGMQATWPPPKSTRGSGKDITGPKPPSYEQFPHIPGSLCRYALPRDPQHRANYPEGAHDLPQTASFPQDSATAGTPHKPQLCLLHPSISSA